MNKTTHNHTVFTTSLFELKDEIDQRIATYCRDALSLTHEQFGPYPAEAVNAYCELLKRGGKRIRGALAVIGYRMLGGKDNEVAIEAALAIEMLHAYILMVDDIQDRSEVRRGGPTAHIMLKRYHEQNHLKDDAQHFGESIAMNGFLFGAHQAINILAGVNVSPEQRLIAIQNVNRHFIATAHGQSMDIFNEVVETVEENAVDKVLLWKTAYYTFMNPLQLGAILAGATENDLQLLENYSLAAGRVFQITDDILGIFSDEVESGKSPLDDIKEGKRTLLTVKAIELAPKADSYFLEHMLGNKQLTTAEFLRCRTIIEESGALAYAQKQAKASVVEALSSLHTFGNSWGTTQIEFLAQLVQFLMHRRT
jgi:geranylgeranyl diphosphate synthase type I